MSLYPKGAKWTLAEMRKLIKNGRNVYVRVACPTVISRHNRPLVRISKEDALELLGKDRPRPYFNAWGDGDVVLG